MDGVDPDDELYPVAPLPRHERSWRHPSEIGEISWRRSEPPITLGRGLLVTTGTIGGILALAVLWATLPTGAGGGTSAVSSLAGSTARPARSASTAELVRPEPVRTVAGVASAGVNTALTSDTLRSGVNVGTAGNAPAGAGGSVVPGGAGDPDGTTGTVGAGSTAGERSTAAAPGPTGTDGTDGLTPAPPITADASDRPGPTPAVNPPNPVSPTVITAGASTPGPATPGPAATGSGTVGGATTVATGGSPTTVDVTGTTTPVTSVTSVTSVPGAGTATTDNGAVAVTTPTSEASLPTQPPTADTIAVGNAGPADTVLAAIAVSVGDDAMIITTAGAVNADDRVTLSYPSGRTTEAKVVLVMPRGLAVLAADTSDAAEAVQSFTPASAPQSGDVVTVLAPSPTQSSVQVGDDGVVTVESLGDHEVAEGTPVVNISGELVGLCSRDADGQGATLLPLGNIDDLRKVVESLGESDTEPVWLGIRLAADAVGALVVESVDADGPAAAGGVVAGDAIVAVDGLAVTTSEELTRQLEARRPEDQVDITVRHADGTEQTLAVTLVARPTPPPAL